MFTAALPIEIYRGENMKIPQMTTMQDKQVEIVPTGGLNVSRLPNEIDDGQSTDMLNMWYKNSMLRNRPGLIKQIEQTYGKILDVCPKDGTLLKIPDHIDNPTGTQNITVPGSEGIFIVTQKAALFFDGTKIIRIPVSWSYVSTYYTPDYTDFSFTKGCLLLSNMQEVETGKSNSLIFISGSGYYYLGAVAYTPSNFPAAIVIVLVIKELDYSGSYEPGSNVAYSLNSYEPTIYTNMKPSGSGDLLEARNYLGPVVKNAYQTTATDTVYHFIDKSIDNFLVTAVYNNLSGTTLTFTFAASVTSSVQGGITATLDRTAGTITFSSALVDAATAEDKVPNLTVKYAKTVYPEPNPIAKCSLSAWFGGSHQGATSGDCIFVSGNPDEPNAVYWSAVGDPTYWPDDNVDYVGAPADPITAFGKAFGALITLKKNSTYMKGFTWDGTKQYFPIYEIHIGIGCDMPDSVQLIANHLVWANSTGGIYTVVSTSTTSSTSNVYSEKNVQPLSQNINRLLLSESKADLQSAVSVDDGYYYHLFVGMHDYCWDYTTTPFINYSDTVKLQNRLAWYEWSIPHAITAAFIYDGKIWGAALDNNFLYAFDPEQSLDDGVWFDAWITSKAFDNGMPSFKKQPYYYTISMACIGIVNVEIQLIDDIDTYSEIESLEGGDSETVTEISLRQPMSWTKQYRLGIRRVGGDNGAFALSNSIIKSKIGKEF
jgi:hypothetical protein